MAATKARTDKKFYTVSEANAALPLVRAIVRDITTLAQSLQERNDRLARFRRSKKGGSGDAYQEEIQQVLEDYERDHDRLQEYEQELTELGIELKDPLSGLIDFRSLVNGREVYLCWRLGEAEVGHWHELDAGFAGRQKLPADSRRN